MGADKALPPGETTPRADLPQLVSPRRRKVGQALLHAKSSRRGRGLFCQCLVDQGCVMDRVELNLSRGNRGAGRLEGAIAMGPWKRGGAEI